jgi:plasmid maintenance system antidote protein VapI
MQLNYTTIKLGKMYGVTRSTISYIVNNKTFKHLLEN